jgi:nicotinamide-nucleotide amidase
MQTPEYAIMPHYQPKEALMKTSLLIVGQSLKSNTLFLEYIYNYLGKLAQFDNQYFFDTNDKDILLDLEQILNTNEKVIIVANKNGFNSISKILCTLKSDSLELKGQTLIPSQATEFSEDSYLLREEKRQIAVLCAKENQVLPTLHGDFSTCSLHFSLVGLDEDSTRVLLEPLAATYEVKLNSTPIIEGWTNIEAKAMKYGDVQSFLEAASSLFPDKIIQNKNPLEYIVQALTKANKTVTSAESCTGGLIASLLTSISGSSSIFEGGIVSYSNDIKRSWLGVSKETLEQYGAVSELCVREMMEGALNASLADFAVATSGVAGPGGGSEEKPVGTVFVGARSKQGEIIVERLLLKGDRNYIQKQSAYHAFRLLLEVGKNYFFKN